MKIRLVSQNIVKGKAYRYYGVSIPDALLRHLKAKPGDEVALAPEMEEDMDGDIPLLVIRKVKRARKR